VAPHRETLASLHRAQARRHTDSSVEESPQPQVNNAQAGISDTLLLASHESWRGLIKPLQHSKQGIKSHATDRRCGGSATTLSSWPHYRTRVTAINLSRTKLVNESAAPTVRSSWWPHINRGLTGMVLRSICYAGARTAPAEGGGGGRILATARMRTRSVDCQHLF